MPPSLNPWGAACTTQVATRWSACAKKDEAVAALHDCLGFKRPPPLAGEAALKAQALRTWSLEMCTSFSPPENGMGARCETEVRGRFERCAGPFLAFEIDNPGFVRCLGFSPPPPPAVKTLATCSRPNIRARLSAKVAHATASPGSKRLVVEGQEFYAESRPVFDEKDVEKLRLEEQDGGRVAWVELSSPAAARLSEVTRASVGEYLVVELAGRAIAPQVQGAISGGKLAIDAGKLGPAELCGAR